MQSTAEFNVIICAYSIAQLLLCLSHKNHEKPTYLTFRSARYCCKFLFII